MSKLQELIKELCPEGVEWNSLDNLGSFYGGLTGKNKDDFKDGNAKYITYTNVYSNFSVDLNIETLVKVSEGENQNSIKYGDIIFTGSSETPDECGMSSVVTEDINEKIYLNSFCFGYRLNDTEIYNPHFLKHLFRSCELRKLISKTASGVTRFNVSKKRFGNIEIPIPPLEVQNEIVRILDTFTSYAAELQARKEQYEYYRNKLLTFDENIKQEKLNTLVSFMNGKGHEKCIEDGGKYIVVNSKFISTNGEIKKYSNIQISPLFKGMILMVMSDLPNGKALAKCFIVDKDDKYTLNQRIGAFCINNTNLIITRFLYYILNRNTQLLAYDNGVDQTNLRKGDILNILIPVPPLSEQQRIVSILDKFESLVNDLTIGLPAEIAAVQEQYEYYRNKLLSFKRIS